MKQIILQITFALALCIAFTSCSSDTDVHFDTMSLIVTMTEGNHTLVSAQGLTVTAKDGHGQTFSVQSDEYGKAQFHLPAGVYHITVSGTVLDGGQATVYNGSRAGVILSGRRHDR